MSSQQAEGVVCPYCYQVVQVNQGELVEHKSGGLATFGNGRKRDLCDGSGWEVPADE